MAYDLEFWDDYTCALPSHPYKCSPACSPQETNEYGIQSFLSLGIAPEKLVLGLPWYGISYENVAGVLFNRGSPSLSDVQKIVAHSPNKPALDSYSYTQVLHCGGKCGATQGTALWAPPPPPPSPYVVFDVLVAFELITNDRRLKPVLFVT
jgi:GH18 family chitinase